MISFCPQPLYRRRKNCRYTLSTPQAGLDGVEKETISLPARKLNYDFPFFQNLQVTVRTELLGLSDGR